MAKTGSSSRSKRTKTTKRKPGTRVITLEISEALLRAVDQRAKLTHRSRAMLLRHVLEEALKEKPPGGGGSTE